MPPSDTKTKMLDAALDTFREQGYSAATLHQVALPANLQAGQLRDHFADKGALLSGLLAAHSPLENLLAAIDAVEGESAEDILRDAMRRMVKAIEQDELFVELAAMDVQFNSGVFVSNLSTH